MGTKTNTSQVKTLVELLELRARQMEKEEEYYAAKVLEFAQKEKEIFGNRAVLLNEIAKFRPE